MSENNNEINLIVFLELLNIDFSEFSPNLKEFIYDEISHDRLSIGSIIKIAKHNENDKAILMREFKIFVDNIPAIVDKLPFKLKMLIQPIILLLKKEN